MDEGEVVKLLISEVGGLAHLLSTLSLAVCGGITGLFFQIIIHNSKENVGILEIRGMPLLLISFLLQSISIFFGYMSKASLLTNIAFYQKLKLVGNIELGKQKNIEFMEATQIFSLIQFLLFFAGMLTILTFIFLNLHLGSKCKHQATEICEEIEEKADEV